MAREINWITPPDRMDGFHIWCFDCKFKIASKSLVKRDHMNHDVDWVRNTDGQRYMFMPDNVLPKAGPNDGYGRDRMGVLR